MQAVLNAALPILALISTGFLCGRFRIFAPASSEGLNRFAIYLALPSATTRCRSAFSWP